MRKKTESNADRRGEKRNSRTLKRLTVFGIVSDVD